MCCWKMRLAAQKVVVVAVEAAAAEEVMMMTDAAAVVVAAAPFAVTSLQPFVLLKMTWFFFPE